MCGCDQLLMWLCPVLMCGCALCSCVACSHVWLCPVLMCGCALCSCVATTYAQPGDEELHLLFAWLHNQPGCVFISCFTAGHISLWAMGTMGNHGNHGKGGCNRLPTPPHVQILWELCGKHLLFLLKLVYHPSFKSWQPQRPPPQDFPPTPTERTCKMMWESGIPSPSHVHRESRRRVIWWIVLPTNKSTNNRHNNKILRDFA